MEGITQPTRTPTPSGNGVYAVINVIALCVVLFGIVLYGIPLIRSIIRPQVFSDRLDTQGVNTY